MGISALPLVTELWIPKNIILTIFAIVAVSCLLTTTLLYYKIYAAVRRHANQIGQAQQVQPARQNSEMENAPRLAVGTFFVYLALLICYFPNICSFVVLIFSGKTTTSKVWRLYAMTLVYLNS